jgi:hypothetical protein
MTGAQKSYVQTLAEEAHEPKEPELTKAEASKEIDRLQAKTGWGQVSKLCKDIDERVNAFLDRPIEGEWPYLWLDATYLKVRDGGRIVWVAAIIAVAVTTEGGARLSALAWARRRPNRSGRLFSRAWSSAASRASSW